MIPEATTHLVISEAADDLVVSEPWTIETYAEGLIDDLFTDIDEILEGNRKLPSQSVRKEYQSGDRMRITVPEVVLSQTANDTYEVISPPPNRPTTTLVVKNPSVTAITPKAETKKDSWGKLLIVGITASLATVGILYLTQSQLIANFTAKFNSANLQTKKLSTPEQPDAAADLVNYMLQSLAVIEQKQENNYPIPTASTYPSLNLNQTTALALPSQPGGTLTPPLIANSLPPIPTQTTSLTRLPNIPVYQAPVPMRYPVPLVPPLPAKLSTPNVSPSPASTATQPVATAVKPALPTVQPVINNQPLRITPPKLPTPQTPVRIPQVAVQQTPVVPKVSAELEGLLELGEKSAGLFKIEGVTQRISLGEAIGASGWTLVEVSKGEAVIRRNGEVRSIYVGQKL